MTSIRKLALALCLAGSFSPSNAQEVDTTGNLINNNNWSGVGAYAPDPNDCCTNPAGSLPLYDTATDTIKWSYQYSNVGQSIGIQSALSQLGTGLVVQGYNYSFEAKNLSENGAGYDTFGYNTFLTNSAGQVLLGDGANLSVPFNWTTFSGTLNLNTPLPLPESGVVGINFYGRDDGFWAGLYGPEVRNASLSLNYSFDPCAADPLYSSSCPGYFQAYLGRLASLLGWGSSPEPEVEVASVSAAVVPATVTSSTPEDNTTGEVKVDAGGVEVSSSGELTVPDGIPEVVKEEKKEKKEIDPNLIASIVRQATDDSKALAIVNQSIEQSLSEESNPDFSMVNETLENIEKQSQRSIEMANESAASGSSVETQTTNLESTDTSNVAEAQGSTVTNAELEILQPQPTDNRPSTALPNQNMEVAMPVETAVQESIPAQQFNNEVSVIEVAIAAPTLTVPFSSPKIDIPIENYSLLPPTVSIPLFNVEPLEVPEIKSVNQVEKNIKENKTPIVVEQNNAQSTATVKKDVKDNDAAGGVTIDKIATEPIDFNAYLNKQLADAQFYQTKDIYKNQVPVDNRRALRLLNGASDLIHQEMVNEQYRTK